MICVCVSVTMQNTGRQGSVSFFTEQLGGVWLRIFLSPPSSKTRDLWHCCHQQESWTFGKGSLYLVRSRPTQLPWSNRVEGNTWQHGHWWLLPISMNLGGLTCWQAVVAHGSNTPTHGLGLGVDAISISHNAMAGVLQGSVGNEHFGGAKPHWG